ncbi:hypothetical protein ACVJGD_002428 [Bradyrhizobium sp. USDA 10063]
MIDAASVFCTSRPHHFCIGAGTSTAAVFEMLDTLTTAAFTFVFLGIVVGLGAAFVLMLWEVERQLTKPRNRDHLG